MWFHSSHKTRRFAPDRRVPHSFRPRLEVLEDRCLLSAGALDPSFGNGAGYVTTAVANGSATAETILLQPDGKIIDAGQVAVSTGKLKGNNFGAVRYNADGSLDKSFGAGGMAIASPPVSSDGFDVHAYSAALYPTTGTANDGMIVLQGWYPVQVKKNTPSVYELALVRFNANGTLDTAFGSGGEVLTSFSVGDNSHFRGISVVITSIGQIVECGADPTTTVLARFNANGALDPTFGDGGKVVMSGSSPWNMIQQSDAKLIVVGDQGGSGGIGKILRYNANGTLDITFGSGGVVTNDALEEVANAAVYPAAGTANDGKIFVVGRGALNGGFELARYNPNGTLDSTFGSGGLVNTQVSGRPRGVALQADGKVVVTGDGSILVRYNADGSLDGTFGTGGIESTNLPASRLRSPVVQPNGDIVVAGQASTFLVARFLPSEPNIGSFTASPNPVLSTSAITLTASNIADDNPGATITQVTFYYYDETGAKHVLGNGTQTSPGMWTLSFKLAPGTYILIAQAEDSFNVFGDPLAITLAVL